MLHIILVSITIVVRPMALVLYEKTVVVQRIVSTIVVVAQLGTPTVVTVLGEKVIAVRPNGHAMEKVGLTVAPVKRITKLLTLVGQQLVAVKRTTVVLVQALPEAQLIPSLQTHAQ